MNTQFFEIYRVGEVIHGTPLRATTTYQLRLVYEYCFSFAGKTACFFFVTEDYDISREDALAFATRIAQGKMVVHHIDLSTWTTKGTIEKCKPTPT